MAFPHIFVGEGTKGFLSAADFHDHVELNHFAVENLNDHFWFINVINILFQVTLRWSKAFI